mgnify:CR=1 FL=1
MGCEHYDRECYILCNICNKYYSCRFCHDNKEEHKINRHNINYIKCINCNTEQKSKQQCITCNIIMGKYFCDKCGLFDSSDKDIYHCNKCKICRTGKKEIYYHCDKCNGCYNKKCKNNHKCIENITKDNCCICLSDMFNSREGMQILKCGHVIHVSCFKEYIKYHVRCPLCKDFIFN